eukprot:gene1840-3562_t
MVNYVFLLCTFATTFCGAFTLRPVALVSASLSAKRTNLRSNEQPGLSSITGKIESGIDKNVTPIVDIQNGDIVPVSPMGLLKRLVAPALVASSIFLFQNQPAFASTLVDTFTEKMSSSGFVQAFLLIFVSEIGDKTFFIAGLLAAKYSRFISFTGSIGALAVMTVLCTILGQVFHAVPSSLTQGIPFDDYIAVAAFAYFGLKTLKDAFDLDPADSSGIEEEREEAEKSVAGLTADQKRKSTIALILQTFSLVFAAEIGDKSFLSTIALSAAQNPFSVATGAIAAHASATGIAVIGGALLTKYLSEKTIGYIGGSLFLLFAITTAFGVF